MEDLEGLAGLRRTKGGSNDTEPAYEIKRSVCWKYVVCLVLTLSLGAVWLWRSEALLKKISPRLAAKRSAMRAASHQAHARFTKLGQELEHHLEHESKEREQAMKLRARLRSLERKHRLNVTRALDAAALGAEGFSPGARDAVKPYVEEALDAFFEELKDALEAKIVAPMISGSQQAYERHKTLHDEILKELQLDRQEREVFVEKKYNRPGDVDGDGKIEDRDYNGEIDVDWEDRYDDQSAEKKDEEWRREILDNFEESLLRHFNDSEKPLRANLLPENALFRELQELEQSLAFDPLYEPNSNSTAPNLSWRDAEHELAELKKKLDAHRCPEYVPNDPPSDDEFDYIQVHHVQHYISNLLWHARLNQAKPDIDRLLSKYHAKTLTTLELIEHLESYEGDGVFPSFWLFHSGHYDDFYRYTNW